MTVAYDGTNYKGWQVQPNGITIEEVLNRHLSSLWGGDRSDRRKPARIPASIRWETWRIFDTTTRMPADKISFALNQRLPEDIVVQGPARFLRTGIRAIRTAARHMSTAF